MDGQNLNFAVPMNTVVPYIDMARTATPKPLPGVSNVTPANLQATLAARYPTFTVTGKKVSPKCALIKRTIAEAHAYVINVGKVFQQAYPGKTAEVVIFHVGMYPSYPSSYKADEIDYRDGGWRVIHLSAAAANATGVWRTSWND